jgi:hypothetical protein
LQPQPQLVLSLLSKAAPVAFSVGTLDLAFDATRVRSPLFRPDLPLVDMARRRARDAFLLLFPDAAREPLAAGMRVGGVETATWAADAVLPGAAGEDSEFGPIAALPAPDNALRLASA